LKILNADKFKPGTHANLYNNIKCISFTRDRNWKWGGSYTMFEINRHNLRAAGYKVVPYSDRYERTKDKNNKSLYNVNSTGHRVIRYESEEMVPGIIKNLKPLINKIIIVKNLKQDQYQESVQNDINQLIEFCQNNNINYEVKEK
jgi:hypothetical protein